MRIVLDYRPALRQRTGVGQYVHQLACALQPQLPPGDSLVLFSSSWKDRLDRAAVPGTASVDARIPVGLLNLAWHRLGWPPLERFTGPADIAHSAHPLLMPASGAAQAVTIHDLDFLDHPERTRAEIRRDYPRLTARHAARADLVVVNSEYTGRIVKARLGVSDDRVVVCRPGAPAWGPCATPAGTGPVVFVGTIEPRKNLPTLFAAYERVISRRPDAPPLLLAGRTVEQSAEILEALARSPSLAGRVRHVGYLTDDARLRLYCDASMLVLPSIEEGFGLTALEAMHLGVPVVASRVGALPELVGDAGTLVDPMNAVEWADAIERLLVDPGRRLAQGQAGRVRAREFSWAASAARLLDAYRETLARRRTRGK